MVHCMSGISFGCIVWCHSAITSLPGLESFPLGSNGLSKCSFHYQVSRRQRCGRVVPHTSSFVLSSPVLMLFQISSVAPSATPADVLACKLKTSWKWLLVWGSLSFQTLRRLDFGGTSILMSHVAELLPLQRSLFYICNKLEHGPTEKDEVCLHGYVSRLVCDEMAVTFLETCSQETGQMLGFSHPQHLVPACHTPSHHALPCIQCLHCLQGHSNLHMGSEIVKYCDCEIFYCLRCLI